MNKIKTLSFFILLLVTIQTFGQSFNYQGVLRGSDGEVLKKKLVGIQFKILQGSASGNSVYQETHIVTTSEYGVVSLSVGAGGGVIGNFSTINWSTQNYWLEVAVDITGGTTYAVLGSSKLQGVPYASYAATSGDKVFTTVNNATSNTSGNIAIDDFVFGSNQLANDGSTNDDDNRMFFDKSKAAFRVGVTPDDLEEGAIGEQWNDTNIGFASFAAGIGSVASGAEAIALGRYHTASGDNSVVIGSSNNATTLEAIAIGSSNTVNGVASIAIGNNVSTSSRSQISLGINNVPISGHNSNFVSTDPLLIVGNGTLVTQSNALVMLKNGNTTLNGLLTIDGDNQGSGKAYTLPAQDGVANQVMTTDGSGTISWIDAATGGVFSTISNITSNASGTIATDDFVFGSTQLNNDPSTVDDERRMFYDKSRGAFRAGSSDGNSWDEVNVGVFSVAIGQQSRAVGANAVSLGAFNDASGTDAVTIGFNNFASGNDSKAFGTSLRSEAKGEIVIGHFNTRATSPNATSWVPTDRLFVIGNGFMEGSNALVMLKNGNTTLNGSLTIDGDNQGSGTSYTLPAQDGSANQVMATDGSGSVTWVNYGLETVSSPTFNTGWQNYSIAHGNGFENARYYVDNGRVYLGGLIRKTSGINVGEVMLTLPVGYRPKKQRIFTVSTEAGIVRVDVAANGNVIFNAPAHNGGQNWVSLDGISFRVD